MLHGLLSILLPDLLPPIIAIFSVIVTDLFFEWRCPHIETWVRQRFTFPDDVADTISRMLRNVTLGWQVVIDVYGATCIAFVNTVVAAMRGIEQRPVSFLLSIVMFAAFLVLLVRSVMVEPDDSAGVASQEEWTIARYYNQFIRVATFGHKQVVTPKDQVDAAIILYNAIVIAAILVER